MSTTLSKKIRTVGAESKPNRLAMLDGRTREAALVRKTRADLLAHLKTPSVVQTALAERAAWLTLRLNLMEARLAGGEVMSDHASRQYIALSNALRRVLDTIGIQPAKPTMPTLAEHLARRAVEATASSSAGQRPPGPIVPASAPVTPPAALEPAVAAPDEPSDYAARPYAPEADALEHADENPWG